MCCTKDVASFFNLGFEANSIRIVPFWVLLEPFYLCAFVYKERKAPRNTSQIFRALWPSTPAPSTGIHYATRTRRGQLISFVFNVRECKLNLQACGSESSARKFSQPLCCEGWEYHLKRRKLGYRIQDGPKMAQLSPQMARVAPKKTQEAFKVKPWDDFARHRSGLGPMMAPNGRPIVGKPRSTRTWERLWENPGFYIWNITVLKWALASCKCVAFFLLTGC